VPLQKTQRVSRTSPCPVCGRATWCRVATNGSYAICNRTESDRPAKGDGGGWVHRLAGGPSLSEDPGQAIHIPPPGAAVAPVARLDAVYRRFLAALIFNGTHRRLLQAKGLDPAEAVCRHYASLPLQGRARVCRRVAEREDLAGVPGFYVADGERGRYWTCAGSPGLLIPVFAPDGRIRGLRVRPGNQGAGIGKYLHFSSRNKKGGTGSGAHCHVARPAVVTDDAVWITEGEIKADIACGHLGAVVLSIPGVASWQRALPDLAELLPQGGCVVLALDADWRKNPAVHAALWNLSLTCPAIGYRTEVALWEPTYKGIDELLTAGLHATMADRNQIPPPAWTLKLTARRITVTTALAGPAGMDLQAMRQQLRRTLGLPVQVKCS
jgi:hypothetical protein